ncbi:membrane progestin receptor epsilon [Esox lucius]|uniref:Progestin and adipoQ receptor family member 9 n=1 Tax=Esox lucius TaxID=8010 RepID=A0AAY5K3C5_ESOLU|nr:membrane progestin receptor epsilon [Esox lucius]
MTTTKELIIRTHHVERVQTVGGDSLEPTDRQTGRPSHPIMLVKCHKSLPPLLKHTDVPARITENFILSGYRFPNYSLVQCLVSAFRPTNETGNFWTHFLPVFVFGFYFAEPFGWEGAAPANDPFFYPLWTYFIGVFCLLTASSMAHLLNSMSLVVREVCFFVDYGTISAYTVGSSLAYHYYIHPRAGIPELGAGGANDSREHPLAAPEAPGFGVFFETFYIPSSCLVAVICVLACCNTRQRWRTYRYVIRTLVFLLPFLVASTPIFYRLLHASPSSPSYDSSFPAAQFFYRHCFWLVASAVFNISKVPERLSPGRFDIWGHSHQWFHVCTFLSILDELHMINGELRAILLRLAPGGTPTAPPHLPGPTMASTYGVMLLLQASIASIIAWFSWCAKVVYEPQAGQAGKEVLAKRHLKCH